MLTSVSRRAVERCLSLPYMTQTTPATTAGNANREALPDPVYPNPATRKIPAENAHEPSESEVRREEHRKRSEKPSVISDKAHGGSDRDNPECPHNPDAAVSRKRGPQNCAQSPERRRRGEPFPPDRHTEYLPGQEQREKVHRKIDYKQHIRENFHAFTPVTDQLYTHAARSFCRILSP